MKNNLLPCDGHVEFHGAIFSSGEQLRIMQQLEHEILWTHDEVMMFGKLRTLSRKMAWFADDGRSYRYAGSEKTPQAWTPLLMELKQACEGHSAARYNSCLLNFYQNGTEGMGWHADDEPSLVPDSAIASLSFGAVRKFSLKHRHLGQRVSLLLDSGSLLVMSGVTQRYWKHSLPKTKKVHLPRINLTFRLMK